MDSLFKKCYHQYQAMLSSVQYHAMPCNDVVMLNFQYMQFSIHSKYINNSTNVTLIYMQSCALVRLLFDKVTEFLKLSHKLISIIYKGLIQGRLEYSHMYVICYYYTCLIIVLYHTAVIAVIAPFMMLCLIIVLYHIAPYQ